ncbi:hypothetical protein D9C73_012105 [Collichthys lucidus]|uniref:Uncharacterized protein n=1 Tax=Collichthys lucidus TaxID=240159 RepID=A0A4U5UV04_COLLU|nr:hypothetical protein D9C73_012105 [Collichthys lucidus]
MSELSSANPLILVNGEAEEQQEQKQDDDAAVKEEEQMSSVSVDEESLEDGAAAETGKQAKMQSVLQQVRNRIRSQVGVKEPKSSILELVQRVVDREMEVTQVNGDPEGEDVSGEEKKQAEVLMDESKDEMDLREEELCAIFEEKLEATKKALRDEFEAQLSQVRKEMQAYADKAVKDSECKMQLHNLREQQESKGPDRRQRPSAAPLLPSRRGRVLTRTMTTIIPKTCAPVIVGPRAKSETLSCSKGESSRLRLRDPMFSLTSNNKQCQSRKPLPPTVHPPLQQRKKPVRAKV